MAEAKNPIVTLRRALATMTLHSDGCGETNGPHMHRGVDCDEKHPCDCGHPSRADAHAALEHVEAVVAAAERVRYLMDEGEEQMKTAAWTTAWNAATEALRAQLVPFQEQRHVS